MATITLTNQARPLKGGEMIVTILSSNQTINFYDSRIKLATKPNIPLANRNVKVVQTLGRTGFLHIDMNTKAPVEFEIKLSAFHQNEQDREATVSLLERVEGQLLRFSFYHDPYATYEGFMSGIKVENTKRYSQTYTATVTVQPYRIFNVNNNRIRINSGDILTFDKGTLAPRLIMQGSGNVSITHNGKTMNFTGVPNVPITVDCVNRRVYHDQGAMGISDYHHIKTSDGYIQLASGKPITWTGVSSMELAFDWRSV